jgi:dCTP deaminase
MNMVNLETWRNIPVGTIRDADIIALAQSHELITDGFNTRSVNQACYELRASDVFYETSASRENKRVEVGAGGYVLRPHTYVTAIVQERIQLPANVLGRVLTKGQLFSIGILPVCTYADPGFAGRLGITLCNTSHRHIVIKPGQPIAKIEFSVLAQPVSKPYTGQHGYESEIWPIPVHLYADETQLRAAGIKPDEIREIERSYGPVVASLMARLRYYEKKVWLQIAVTVLGFLILFYLVKEIGLILSVLTGVCANLITTLGFHIATRTKLLIGRSS